MVYPCGCYGGGIPSRSGKSGWSLRKIPTICIFRRLLHRLLLHHQIYHSTAGGNSERGCPKTEAMTGGRCPMRGRFSWDVMRPRPACLWPSPWCDIYRIYIYRASGTIMKVDSDGVGRFKEQKQKQVSPKIGVIYLGISTPRCDEGLNWVSNQHLFLKYPLNSSSGFS